MSKVILTPELLEEMDALQIYGGGSSDPLLYPGCTQDNCGCTDNNCYCQKDNCGCIAQRNCICVKNDCMCSFGNCSAS